MHGRQRPPESNIMGPLLSHLSVGLFLAVLGLRRTYTIISSAASSSSASPLAAPPRFGARRVCFLILETSPLLFAIVAITLDVLDFTQHPSSHDPHNTPTLTALISLHLPLYAWFTLAFDRARSPRNFDARATILALSALAQGLLFLRSVRPADPGGLEDHCYHLLQLATAAAAASTVATAWQSWSFMPELLQSGSVLLMGCWLLFMALILWTPWQYFSGCVFLKGPGVATCLTDNSLDNAKAMADVHFSYVIAGIWWLMALMYHRKLRKDGVDSNAEARPPCATAPACRKLSEAGDISPTCPVGVGEEGDGTGRDEEV